MSGLLSQKISFDAEDRPPPSYYGSEDKLDKTAESKTRKKLNEAEWVKAPEFVPRQKLQPIPVEPRKPCIDLLHTNKPFAYQTTFINEPSCTPPDLTAPSPSGLGCLTPRFVASLPQPVLRQPHPQAHLRPRFFPLPLLPPGFLPLVGPMAASGAGPLLHNAGFRVPMRPQLMNQHGFAKAGPFRPHIALSKTLQSGGAKNSAQGIPQGYSANVTTFDSGIGPPIPAIILKKKRKKRNKNKPKDNNQIMTEGACESKDSTPDTVELVKRSSEPDLTKLISTTHNTDADSKTDYNDKSHIINHKFQNDPDVIQTAVSAIDNDTCMLTGSCPDLSQAQRDYFDQFWDECVENDNLQSTSDEFNSFVNHQTINQSSEQRVNPFNNNGHETMRRASQDRIGHEYIDQSNLVCGLDDYDVASPAVFSAMQDAAQDGNIRSEAVRALDRQVVKEMGLGDKLVSSYINDNGETNSDDDDDGEDKLYERLIKDTHHRLKDKPFGAPNSLLDELEERGPYFPPKPSVHVHQSKSYMANNNRGAFDAYYPPCTYIEEEHMNGMHITVNAFQDPEELILDDDQGDEPSRMDRLHGAFSRLKASISEPQLYPPPKPCCTIM